MNALASVMLFLSLFAITAVIVLQRAMQRSRGGGKGGIEDMAQMRL